MRYLFINGKTYVDTSGGFILSSASDFSNLGLDHATLIHKWGQHISQFWIDVANLIGDINPDIMIAVLIGFP